MLHGPYKRAALNISKVFRSAVLPFNHYGMHAVLGYNGLLPNIPCNSIPLLFGKFARGDGAKQLRFVSPKEALPPGLPLHPTLQCGFGRSMQMRRSMHAREMGKSNFLRNMNTSLSAKWMK